jgi:hypothetical protein
MMGRAQNREGKMPGKNEGRSPSNGMKEGRGEEQLECQEHLRKSRGLGQ